MDHCVLSGLYQIAHPPPQRLGSLVIDSSFPIGLGSVLEFVGLRLDVGGRRRKSFRAMPSVTPKGCRHLMITPPIFNHPIFFTHKMVNEVAISAAIADLKTQAKPNYDATAKKYGIDRNTLRRRFEGKTVSKIMI